MSVHAFEEIRDEAERQGKVISPRPHEDRHAFGHQGNDRQVQGQKISRPPRQEGIRLDGVDQPRARRQKGTQRVRARGQRGLVEDIIRGLEHVSPAPFCRSCRFC